MMTTDNQTKVIVNSCSNCCFLVLTGSGDLSHKSDRSSSEEEPR